MLPAKFLLPLAIGSLLAPFLCIEPAEAKLGEDFAPQRGRITRGFTYKSETRKDDRTNYMYTMAISKSTSEAAPNFGAGLTITVVKGKVTAESMVIRFGDQFDTGKALAAAQCLDFVYECLGKPANRDKEVTNREIESYKQALDTVMAGSSQNINYPGLPGRVTIKRMSDNSIYLTALPEVVNAPPAGPIINH